MKTILKLLKWLLVVVVVLLVVAVLARNFLVRSAIQIGAHQATGFPLAVGSVDIGLFNGKLEVRNVKLSNPREFEDSRFVDLPRLYVDYKLGSMLRRSPHIVEMDIQLTELVLVKNAAGEYNATKLKNVATASSGSSQPAPQDEKPMPYRVDKLHMKVGTVIVRDFSRGTGAEKKYVLNLDETFTDLTESTNISKLVLATVLKKVGIPDLSGFTDQLGKDVGGVLKGAGDAVKGTTDTLQKTGKGVLDVFKKR